MGQVLQFKRPAAANNLAVDAPAAPAAGAVLADAGAWSPDEVPTLEPAVRQRLAYLVSEAKRLPVHEYYETPEGFAEFGAVDFVDMNKLYRALSAPAVETLDTASWRQVHLAIAVVVVPALKLLVDPPRTTLATRWSSLGAPLVSYLEAVARGTASAEDWRAVADEHRSKYGHLPLHDGR